MSKRTDWARYFVSLGWHIFPCVGKAPATANGVLDAAADFRPWLRHDQHNIGIAMGASRLLGIDLDTHKDACPKPCPLGTGIEWLAEAIAAYGADFTRTATQLTPTGGKHLIMALPETMQPGEVGNHVGLWWHGKRWHVDTRDGNGYLVGAGSQHPNGGFYTFAEGSDPISQPPLELSHGLRHWLTVGQRRPEPPQRQPSTRITGTGDMGKRVDGYTRKVADVLPSEVGSAAPGTRNDTLNAKVYHLGRMVAAGRVDAARAITILHDMEQEALRSGLETREIMNIMRRTFDAGNRRPLASLPNETRMALR